MERVGLVLLGPAFSHIVGAGSALGTCIETRQDSEEGCLVSF
jgi:hypothetical protein